MNFVYDLTFGIRENSKLNFLYPFVNPTLILMFKNSTMFLVQYSIGKVNIEKEGTHLEEMTYT